MAGLDWKQVVASIPLLRRVWRWLPGPLRIIVVVVAIVIAVGRLMRKRGAPDGQSGDASSRTSTSEGTSANDR